MALQALASDDDQYEAKLENDVQDERDGIDLEPDKDWPWFDYSFNGKSIKHLDPGRNMERGDVQSMGKKRRSSF